MRKFLCLLSLIIGSTIVVFAGRKLHVLFIGNSYTYVNTMPAIVANIAADMGDTLVWEMQAPGGHRYIDHIANTTTTGKIASGGWDYVVLQEQSQILAFPDALAFDMSFKPARQLDSVINKFNPCAETVFYMTWGRKNGDVDNCQYFTNNYNWPYLCTYAEQDSLLRLRYRMLADSNNAIVSPAGATWRYLRANHPAINLYDADGSHPSQAGSYAAACAFYATLFRNNPSLSNYNYTLSATDAATIRNAAKEVVYDSLAYWHIGRYRTEASFTSAGTTGTVTFNSTSVNASMLTWYFGDGQSATGASVTHSYVNPGNYHVMLVAESSSSGCKDTAHGLIYYLPNEVGDVIWTNVNVSVTPNPTLGEITIYSNMLPAEGVLILLTNSFGQLILSEQGEGGKPINLNIRDYPAGVYNLSVLLNRKAIYRSQVVKY